jgi:hypothetical protein
MTSKHISAKSGDPNTFWQGASGRWYCTKKEAETDEASAAVNPDTYVIKKTFWNAHSKQIYLIAGIITIALVAYMAYTFKDKLVPKELNKLL